MENNRNKIRLSLGIEILQKYGREGATIADQLLKDTIVDSPEFDRENFLADLEQQLKKRSI